MIKISKDEAKFLRDNGYGRMITVAGGGHGSKQKTYYLDEQHKVMEFYRQHFGSVN